jgi:DNA-binding IclR family transcriptional regulator
MVTGDRIPGLAGISAPVWRSGGDLAGALTLTAPEQRVQPAFVDELRASAARLTRALGGATADRQAADQAGENDEH